MIRDAGDALVVETAMTLPNATALLERGCAMLTKPENRFDLSAVREVDSSGLAVVFAWQRAAAREGRRVRLSGVPESLRTLASLYGVDDLPPLA